MIIKKLTLTSFATISKNLGKQNIFIFKKKTKKFSKKRTKNILIFRKLVFYIF